MGMVTTIFLSLVLAQVFVDEAPPVLDVVVDGASHLLRLPPWLEARDVPTSVRGFCSLHAMSAADCGVLAREADRRRGEHWGVVAGAAGGVSPSAAWSAAWNAAQQLLDAGDVSGATALWDRLLRSRRSAPWGEATGVALVSEWWAKREARAAVQLGFLQSAWDGGLPNITEMPGGVERHVWSLTTSGSSLLTSVHKLRHDALQLEHLLRQGRLRREDGFGAALERLNATYTLAAGSGAAPTLNSYFVPNQRAMRAVDALHQTLYYVPPSPRVEPSALNLDLDWNSIEERYLGETPSIAVIDGMLSAPALRGVRDFCLEATVFFDTKPGYVGAYMREGFHSPLLLQIAEELVRMLPRVLGGRRLTKMWAYKYDSELQSGIRIHTDPAAVNLNLWITPDDANLDLETGGIVVWRNQPEGGNTWLNSWADADVEEVRRRLERGGADQVVVPHRQNRCVFFDSNLYHATQPFNFARGYSNRRINLTFLFL